MAANPSKRLRKRAETWLSSPRAQAAPAALVARHLRRAFAATEWEMEGRDALAAEVAQGQAVILASWHGRLLCTPKVWDSEWGTFTTLTSQAYPGRLAGQAFVRFGQATVALHDKRTNRADTLPLARAVRSGGMSLGIAVDGPLGPARVAKTVPLDWSRLTGAPIWLIGFSMTRFRLLNSWDRLMVPRPGGRAALLCRRFGAMEKGADPEAERVRLQAELDVVTEDADRRMGHPGLLA